MYDEAAYTGASEYDHFFDKDPGGENDNDVLGIANTKFLTEPLWIWFAFVGAMVLFLKMWGNVLAQIE